MKQRTADAEEVVRPKKRQRTPADAEKSPYLVVGHGCESPAYSVFKVEPYNDGGRGDTPVSTPLTGVCHRTGGHVRVRHQLEQVVDGG